jgi:putative flavoprotein involved in K+ transport
MQESQSHARTQSAPQPATGRDTTPAKQRLDIVVIGGGQAGLATGYFLRNMRLSFLILERHERPGESWRQRYDSLRLFSPRSFSALPGLALAGDPKGLPTKDEIADYLERFAATFQLPVVSGEGVALLQKPGNEFLVRTTRERVIAARAVIVAAGAFQCASVPGFAGGLSADVQQFTAQTYRRPGQVAGPRILVVGGGASGRQIARELADERDVTLSVGRRALITPQRLLGRDMMWWSRRTGALTADKTSRYGRFLRAHDAFPGLHLRSGALRRAGVRIAGRAIGAEGRHVHFARGKTAAFDAVIWATGHHDDTSWLAVAGGVDVHGNYAEDRGISPVPGLFHIGRSWQNNRGSALLCGVGRDANEIVHRVAQFLQTTA